MAHPADLRKEWRRKQARKLTAQTQLDLFANREQQAAEALQKLEQLYSHKRREAP
jgi:hypothetical protein